jgi:hypothetical protein
MTGLLQRWRARLGDRRSAWLLIGGCTLLALGVRLWWTLHVQPPDEAIFSDMRSYVHRAVWLLFDQQHVSRYRELDAALFPYGTHYLLALLLRACGLATPDLPEQIEYSFAGVDLAGPAVAWALLGAGTVAFAMLAARLAFGGLRGPLAVGALLALWHPLITYTGYFTSETPFACFLALGFWLCLRYASTGRGAWLAGVALAAGFTFRPQLLLTALLLLSWVALRHRRIPGFCWPQLAWLALPVALVVAFSAWRYHSLAGEPGLISGNAALGRFFAATDYESVEADGGKRFFHPPARSPQHGFEGRFRVLGFISDAEPLDAERERVWASRSRPEKLATLARNVSFLFHRNRLWPERAAAQYAGLHAAAKRRMELEREGVPPEEARRRATEARREAERDFAERGRWRTVLLRIWEPVVLFGLLPLSLVGLGLAFRRFNPGLELAALHVATMVCAAAMYFGEARYRVPYDPILVLLAAVAALRLLRLVPVWKAGRRRGSGALSSTKPPLAVLGSRDPARKAPSAFGRHRTSDGFESAGRVVLR